MDWKDLLFLAGLIGVAVFILQRTFRKKKFCPAICGSGSDDSKDKGSSENAKP